MNVALVLRAQQLLGEDPVAPAEAELEARAVRRPCGARGGPGHRAGATPPRERRDVGRPAPGDRRGSGRGRGAATGAAAGAGVGTAATAGAEEVTGDDASCLGERRGRGDADAVAVAAGVRPRWRLGAGACAAVAASAAAARAAAPSSTLMSVFADADLVAEGQRALVDALAVDPGALDAAHVDDRQRAVRGDLDDRVDAADLLVVEAEVGRGQSADLDDVAVVVLRATSCVALEDLECEGHGHGRCVAALGRRATARPPTASPCRGTPRGSG